MENKVTLQKIIAFLRIHLMFACCWPLSRNATKLQRLLRGAFRYFCCANSMIYIVAVLWTLHKRSKDYMVVLKLGCELSVALQILLQLILFATQDKRLQFIVWEIEDYYQQAKKYEKEVFQYYVDKCKMFYGSVFFAVIVAVISMITIPLFLPQPFPSVIEYPFDVQYQPLKTIIYAHQVLTAYQSMTQINANCFSAFLLWFVVARFHILSIRFRKMTNMKELIMCMREHNILLRFAKEVTLAIRYIALLCVTFSIGAVIFGYFTFMSREPWSVKYTYFIITYAAFVELYMYAWPAHHVTSMSSDIASAVYDSLWYNDNLVMRKLLTIVMLRSQRPVIVSVPGVLPNLSLHYYTSYISIVYSYMAVIRILIDQK